MHAPSLGPGRCRGTASPGPPSVPADLGRGIQSTPGPSPHAAQREQVGVGRRADVPPSRRAFRSVAPLLRRNALVTTGLFAVLFAWGDTLFALTPTTTDAVRPVTLGLYDCLGAHSTRRGARDPREARGRPAGSGDHEDQPQRRLSRGNGDHQRPGAEQRQVEHAEHLEAAGSNPRSSSGDGGRRSGCRATGVERAASVSVPARMCVGHRAVAYQACISPGRGRADSPPAPPGVREGEA